MTKAPQDHPFNMFDPHDETLAGNNETQQKLPEQKDRAQLYLDIVPVIILSLDLEGNIKMINEQGLRVLKATVDDVIGKDWINTFVPETDREKVMSAFNILKQGRENVQGASMFENYILDTEQGKHLIYWKNRVIRNENGEVVEILTSGEDITQKKAVASSLIEVEQKFKTYFEKSPQGIFVTNNEGKYTMVNPAACEMMGYEESELLTLGVTHLIPEADKEQTLYDFSQLLQTGSLRKRYQMLKKDGTIIMVLINAVMLPNGEAIAFCEDLTNEAAIEKQIREQNEQLMRMNQLMIDRELKMVELKEQLKQDSV